MENKDMEKALLGSLIVYPDLLDEALVEIGNRDLFTTSPNKLLFKIIKGLYNKNNTIDHIIVKDYIKEHKLESKLSCDYVDQIILYESVNAMQYISLLKEKYIKSELKKTITLVKAKIENGDGTSQELLDMLEKKSIELQLDTSHAKLDTTKELAKDIIIEAGEILEHKQKMTGVPTGFKDLDASINGFHPSELIVIAGRPSMGKTAFALNIMLNNVRKGIPMGFFSLEMPSKALMWRMVCARTGIDASKIRGGYMSKSEYQNIATAAGELSAAPIYIDDSSTLNTTELRARARKMKLEYNVQVIFIDYMQLLNSARRYDSKTAEVSDISRALKGIARELNIPVVALSQLSRALMQRQGREPILSDLRESGAIEQDADVVMFVHRPTFIDKNSSEEQNIAKIIIGKQRNGPVGTIKLVFDSKSTHFGDYTDEVLTI